MLGVSEKLMRSVLLLFMFKHWCGKNNHFHEFYSLFIFLKATETMVSSANCTKLADASISYEHYGYKCWRKERLILHTVEHHDINQHNESFLIRDKVSEPIHWKKLLITDTEMKSTVSVSSFCRSILCQTEEAFGSSKKAAVTILLSSISVLIIVKPIFDLVYLFSGTVKLLCDIVYLLSVFINLPFNSNRFWNTFWLMS